MKNRKLLITAAVGVVLAGLHPQPAQGANIAVTNITLTSALYAGRVAVVKFDVKWDASWRASWPETTPSVTVTNWDAAWIFVKYRCRDGADTNWNHASLSTNNSDHVAPAGSTINVGLSTNAGGAYLGAGVFLYRSTDNSGSWTNTGVKLRWRYGADGVASTAHVDVCVHAIEMVYVPQGSFYAGDGSVTTPHGRFENGNSGSSLQITSEGSLTLGGGGAGSLGNTNTTGMAAGYADDFSNNNGNVQTLPGAFPKGFSAFYCMKYEISQGQYADFLNQLTYTQATNRYYATAIPVNRYTITNLPPYSATAPTRACNYLSWADGAAYADWAGLRPISELEFEKACRGPLNPVADEYAWGTNTIIADNGDKTINVCSPSGLEDGTETNNTLGVTNGAAVCHNRQIGLADVNAGKGPVRCGLFATANSGRVSSGSTYWGIMEMSGNVVERPVTVGNSTGRGFTGVPGDGKLTGAGDADAPSWPGSGSRGAGFRGGGCFDSPAVYLRGSSRFQADEMNNARNSSVGWRAGRSAPVVNP